MVPKYSFRLLRSAENSVYPRRDVNAAALMRRDSSTVHIEKGTGLTQVLLRDSINATDGPRQPGFADGPDLVHRNFTGHAITNAGNPTSPMWMKLAG